MSLSSSASIDLTLSGGLQSGDSPLYRLIVSPFPPGHFVVQSFKGREKISGLYSFDVVVIAPILDEGVVERLALGQRAVLVLRSGKAPRAFHGIVSAVSFEGVHPPAQVAQYRIRLVPKLWLLKQRKRTRIFQDLRVDQVIEAVLREANIDVRFQLQQDYPVREYCTQYEETDYRFIERLAAEAGMFFYFTQSGAFAEEAATALGSAVGGAAGAVLGAAANAALSQIFATGEAVVFGDDALTYPPIDDGSLIGAAAEALGASVGLKVSALGTSASIDLASPALYYLPILGTSTPGFDKVTRFEPTQRVRTNASMYREYDPERPHVPLVARASASPHGAAGIAAELSAGAQVSLSGGGVEVSARASVDVGGALAGALGALGALAEAPELEHYEHHAPFMFAKWDYGQGEPARILRQRRRKAHIGHGESTCPALAAGHRFRLEDHPASHINRGYVVTTVLHEGVAKPRSDAERAMYRNTFSCAPDDIVYCPPRPRRRSTMVALTATVTGPLGEEIYTNARGQVMVQFHWDREGRNDERSSCWIRTMHPWSGTGWGVQFIPRVGMEVVVAFESGDPDKPIVLGSVYNGTHPSPFRLPEDKTRSGWRTQSSPGGGGFNELSFEDAKGGEQIYVHAQRNLDEVVGKNHTLVVRDDEFIHILGKRIDTIEKNLERLVKGDRISRVAGNSVDVVTGNADERISGMLVKRVEGRERRDVQGLADLVYADDLTVRVLGCSTTIVGKNDKKRSWTTHAEGTAALSGLDRLELTSDAEVHLKVGDSSIRMTKDRIELSAAAIVTSGEGGKLSVTKDGLAMKSSDTQVTLSDKLVMKSPNASLAMGDELKLDGKKILLNSPEQATDEPPKQEDPPTKVEVVDQDGNPVPLQRFIAKLDDGSEVGGMTNKDGKAELEIPSSGKIVFPELTMEGEPPQEDMRPYVIRQGDHLARLAFVHGFDPDKVWSHGKNAELKEKRKKPNVLHPGDILYLPRAKREGLSLKKSTTNSFSVNIPKKTLRLLFKDERLFNAKYVIEGLGAPLPGTTDGSGVLTAEVPVHVREINVVFAELHVEYEVRIGDLDPVDETTGARKRLEHLGYRKPTRGASESDAEAEAADRDAIMAFQEAKGLEATGEMDDATRAALMDAHGS